MRTHFFTTGLKHKTYLIPIDTLLTWSSNFSDYDSTLRFPVVADTDNLPICHLLLSVEAVDPWNYVMIYDLYDIIFFNLMTANKQVAIDTG